MWNAACFPSSNSSLFFATNAELLLEPQNWRDCVTKTGRDCVINLNENHRSFPLAQSFTTGSRVPTGQEQGSPGFGLAFRQLFVSDSRSLANECVPQGAGLRPVSFPVSQRAHPRGSRDSPERTLFDDRRVTSVLFPYYWNPRPER
jgi:hypothetical protein